MHLRDVAANVDRSEHLRVAERERVLLGACGSRYNESDRRRAQFIQEQLGSAPDLLVGTVDPSEVQRARTTVPVLANRRF